MNEELQKRFNHWTTAGQDMPISSKIPILFGKWLENQ